MVDIAVPAHIPAFDTMESSPERAQTFATNVRAVLASVKDIQQWAERNGAPAGWTGEASEAAAHGGTRMAGALEAPEAALLKAATACDRFEDRLRRLRTRRQGLVSRRGDFNEDRTQLLTDIEDASDDADAATVTRLQDRATRLTTRHTTITADIATWETDYQDAENDFITALQSVDTRSEGTAYASSGALPDMPALSRQLRRHAGDPDAMNAWWRKLSRAEKQALMTEYPEVVGNADGIPVADRDEANRTAVYRDIDYYSQRDADGQLTAAERSAYENAKTVRDAIRRYRVGGDQKEDRTSDLYRDKVDRFTGDHLFNVLVYKPFAHTSDGAIAVSLGDPDRAAHTSVNVPGLTTETSSLDGNLNRMEALHNSAIDNVDGSVATVFWLDYDAPSGNPLDDLKGLDPKEFLTDPSGATDDLLNKVYAGDFSSVAGAGDAADGGRRLADFIDGLRASDRGEQSHLTLIGHSYGSTTAGYALMDHADVDDAIVIGSPGQPMATAAQLTDAHVYVGSKDFDPVTLLGMTSPSDDPSMTHPLGYDPAQESFGGTRFATGGPGDYDITKLLDNHTSYYDKGSESLENMGNIVTGEDADGDGRVDVTTEAPREDAGQRDFKRLEDLLAGTGTKWVDEWAEDHIPGYEEGKGIVKHAEDGANWAWEQTGGRFL